jgi:tetratricopeptide (TPR) repeat protein
MKARRPRPSITVRELPGHQGFELVHPPGARQRAEDLAEVQSMLAAGELEVAEAELRWLLEGCHQLLEAHQLLGQIAFDEGHWDLARGHFGRAFEMGLEALGPKFQGQLPDRPANRPFLAAAKGLALTLQQLGEEAQAREVLQQLRKLAPLYVI